MTFARTKFAPLSWDSSVTPCRGRALRGRPHPAQRFPNYRAALPPRARRQAVAVYAADSRRTLNMSKLTGVIAGRRIVFAEVRERAQAAARSSLTTGARTERAIFGRLSAAANDRN